MEENGEAKWNVVEVYKKAKEQAEAKKNEAAAKTIEASIKKEDGAAAKKNEATTETHAEQEEGDAV